MGTNSKTPIKRNKPWHGNGTRVRGSFVGVTRTSGGGGRRKKVIQYFSD